MKKKYLSPTIEVTRIVPHQIIAASLLLKRGGQSEDEIWDESEMLSRNYSIWDEE